MTYLDVLPFHWDPATVSDADIFVAIREWRNKELAASDWTQLPDVDATAIFDKWAWAVYRQELRDMVNSVIDPKLVVFPVKPS